MSGFESSTPLLMIMAVVGSVMVSLGSFVPLNGLIVVLDFFSHFFALDSLIGTDAIALEITSFVNGDVVVVLYMISSTVDDAMEVLEMYLSIAGDEIIVPMTCSKQLNIDHISVNFIKLILPCLTHYISNIKCYSILNIIISILFVYYILHVVYEGCTMIRTDGTIVLIYFLLSVHIANTIHIFVNVKYIYVCTSCSTRDFTIS